MIKRKEVLEEVLKNLFLIKRKMMACGHSFSEKTGITHSQVQLLHIVQQNNGIGMKEIAKTLGISSSAATQLVDGLVNHNHLIRENSTDDRRALKLNLSPDCKANMSKIRRHGMEKIGELFDGLTDEELKVFSHLSCKIIENINKKKSKIVNNGGLRGTYKVLRDDRFFG